MIIILLWGFISQYLYHLFSCSYHSSFANGTIIELATAYFAFWTRLFLFLFFFFSSFHFLHSGSTSYTPGLPFIFPNSAFETTTSPRICAIFYAGMIFGNQDMDKVFYFHRCSYIFP